MKLSIIPPRRRRRRLAFDASHREIAAQVDAVFQKMFGAPDQQLSVPLRRIEFWIIASKTMAARINEAK
jgi:hypothetical protein